MNNVQVTNLESEFEPADGIDGIELDVDGTIAAPDEGVLSAWAGAGVRRVELAVKTNAVRYTLDGSDPVSSGAGIILATGIYHWSIRKLRAAKFIESAGSSASVMRFEAGV